MEFKRPTQYKELKLYSQNTPETIVKRDYEKGHAETVLLEDHLNGALTESETALMKTTINDKTAIVDYTTRLKQAIEEEINTQNMSGVKEKELDEEKRYQELLKLRQLEEKIKKDLEGGK